MPRRKMMDQRKLFADIATRSASFVQAVAQRFEICGKYILSVGAGNCAEEGLLAAAGADVDCVDPFAAHLDTGRELTPSLSPKGTLAFFPVRHEAFEAPRRYDLVWASCPQDWMSTSVLDVLPGSFAAATPLRLREYWLSDTGWYALAVATCGIADLPPAPAGFETFAARWRQGATCKFEWPQHADIRPSPLQRPVP